MSFQAALHALSRLSVTGIAHNYAIDTLPDRLHRPQLPALMVMPIENQATQLFQERGIAFQGVAFSEGVKTVQYVTTHLLLVAPAQRGHDLREHLPRLVECIDAYMAALAGNIMLNDTLEHPAQVQIEPGHFTVNHSAYIGCAFRHTWIIRAD